HQHRGTAMPHDREAISSRTSGRRAAEEAGARRVGIWSVVGVGFTWIVVMAVWQKGFTGYLLAFMFLYVAFAVLSAVALARYAFRRYAAPMCAFGLLLAWWDIGGTYSWQRDALLGTAAFLAVLVAFPSSRIWLRRLPRRLRALWRLW